MLMNILLFLVVFTIVALVHEFGHMIAAKRAGIMVYEIALGFGPRLISFKRGETTYALNLIPFLAYVKLAGMGDDEEDKACPEERKYYAKKPWQKFKTTFTGPFMNIILAFVILSLIFAFVGVPKKISNEIESIVPNSPASKIGLKSGDKLLALNGRPVKKMEEAIGAIHKSPGKPMSLKIDRGGKVLFFKVVPKYNKRLKVSLIGFSPKPIYVRVNPLVALYYGAQQTLSMVALLFIIIWQLITGALSVKELAGPVGIAQITGRYAQSGFLALLHFLAFLNVNIGVLNLLPIPALDGGHIVFIFIHALRGRPIDFKKENQFHQWGMIALLALMALITINDLLRIFRPK